MSQLITANFIQLLKSGQSEAWSDLFDLYAPSLYGVILQKVPNANAESALENTFLKLYEHIAAFAPDKEQLFTWMYCLTLDMIGAALTCESSAKEIKDAATDAYQPESAI